MKSYLSMKKILLASNNKGKIERFKHLISKAVPEIEIITPTELGLVEIDVVEDGVTLAENAEKKSRAYFGHTDIPILANDTGFWLETEGFVDAPKRFALGNKNEAELTKEDISKIVLEFWKTKAFDAGGVVDGAWIEAFFLLNPDGTSKTSHSRREIILTGEEYGVPPLQMPVRALYISKTTNKPAIQHTHEEELEEMLPVINALKELFT